MGRVVQKLRGFTGVDSNRGVADVKKQLSAKCFSYAGWIMWDFCLIRVLFVACVHFCLSYTKWSGHRWLL